MKIPMVHDSKVRNYILKDGMRGFNIVVIEDSKTGTKLFHHLKYLLTVIEWLPHSSQLIADFL